MLLGLAFSLVGNRDRSRFGISWMHAGTVAALSVPATLIGEWLFASLVAMTFPSVQLELAVWPQLMANTSVNPAISKTLRVRVERPER